MFFFTVFFQPGRMSGEKKKTNLFPSLFLPLRTPLSQDTGEILGVHIIGLHAADLIHEASNAVATGQRVQDIKFCVHSHPTLSEVLDELFKGAHVDAKAPARAAPALAKA
jgi:hypothetical protein